MGLRSEIQVGKANCNFRSKQECGSLQPLEALWRFMGTGNIHSGIAPGPNASQQD